MSRSEMNLASRSRQPCVIAKARPGIRCAEVTRMKFASVIVFALLPACLDASKGEPATALDYDAHFVGLVGSYATPEDCLANEQNPFVCEFSLSFCKNGRVGFRQGDLVYDGTYDLDGNIARIHFTGPGSVTTEDFDFDVV